MEDNMFNPGKLTEEQRLEKAVLQLMTEKALQPVYGVMMIGTKRVCDKTPTAYTDGKNEVYGRRYVAGMSDKKFRGLILHELGHKMFMHLTTWHHLFKIDPGIANLAADYVVDQWVQDMIDGGVNAEVPDPTINPKYKGFSVQQVFDDLRKNGVPPRFQGKDVHDWEAAQQMTPEQRQQLAQDIDSALRQGFANIKPCDRDRTLGELLTPKVDWREALREFVVSLCSGSDFGSWTRPNRRYIGMGHYLPSGVSQRVGEILFAIDTSGSIGTEALNEFLTEVVAVCETVRPERVRLLYWGSDVVREEVYEQDKLASIIHSTKPKGGGGTDPQCVADYIAAQQLNPKAVVVLTDGYVPRWGNWAHPVLWCVIGDSCAMPDVGRAVYVG